MSVNKVNSDGSLTMIAGRGTATDTLKADFSTVETTSTSTRAYNQGDSFIMETGQLVKATTAIAIGDTIAIGTNVVATSVAELLANKVDKEAGKDLSTNDYDNTAKGIVDSVTTNLATKADKVTNATNGNLAGLNSSGNLTDSTWSADKTSQSATGNPISISGLKSNQLAINPIITFEPIQAGSGTPSPSNIRAISGYDKIEVLSCGINTWDEQWEVGSIGNNTGENETDNANIRSKEFNVIKPATTYYCKVASGYIWIHYYDANKNWISGNSLSNGGGVFTVPNNSNIKYFRIRTTNNYGSIYQNDIGINYPATETSYVASNKTTDLSESLGQTVYGATWYPRTGKLTGTLKAVDLGTLTWQYINSFFYATSPSDSISDKSGGYDVVCAAYACYKGSINVMPNLTVTFNNTSWGGSKNIAIKDTTAGTDPVAFKNAMSGVLLVYPIETPFTIQLTPHEISLLKDYAYVSTNGTSMSFSYHNGEMASLSDVSQLWETVALLDRPQERKTIVNITSYNTSSNKYSCEFDGYITALIPSGTGYVRVTIYDDLSQTMGISQRYAKSDGDEYYAVFVKKGMKAMVTASSGISPTVTFRGMA